MHVLNSIEPVLTLVSVRDRAVTVMRGLCSVGKRGERGVQIHQTRMVSNSGNVSVDRNAKVFSSIDRQPAQY
jgi:acetolactate synthase regulatory subunit